MNKRTAYAAPIRQVDAGGYVFVERLYMTNTGRAGQRSMPGVADDCNKLRMTNLEVSIMLGWALTFLVIALIAALLGFGGIAGAAAGIAKVLFFVFVVLFLVSIIAGGVRKRA